MVRTSALIMSEVHRTYGTGEGAVPALRNISLTLERGSFTAVMGPSGSGKTSLLYCAAGLDRLSSGSVVVGGTDLTGLTEKKLTRLRRERIGFVFQAYNLIPALTAQDNITMPLRLQGKPLDRAWAMRVVNQLDMTHQLHHRPAELSGGEQQRVAIARALICRPDLVLADEPTGALDSHRGAQVMGLLRDAAESLNQTVLMVTHSPQAASYAQRVVFLTDGEITQTLENATAAEVADHMSQLGKV